MNNSSDVSPFYLGYAKNDCYSIRGDKTQINAKRKRSNDSWIEIYIKNIYNVGSEPNSKCVLIEKLGSWRRLVRFAPISFELKSFRPKFTNE